MVGIILVTLGLSTYYLHHGKLIIIFLQVLAV